MSYKFAGCAQTLAGTCITVNSSAIIFRTDRPIDAGKALEVRLHAGALPPMTAFVQVMRSFEEDEDAHIIAAEIKGIKGT